MSDSKSRLRSELPNAQSKQEQLDKIKALFLQKSRRLVIEIAGARFSAADCPEFSFDPNTDADGFTFTRPTTRASLEVQDLTYTALAAGASGDDITIKYEDTATAGSETVNVTGTDIVVGIEDGVSTAAQVKAAVEADEDSAALVSTLLTGSPSVAQTVQVETPLDGGDAPEYYNLSDIVLIKRLRNKKYLIKLDEAADPAQD